MKGFRQSGFLKAVAALALFFCIMAIPLSVFGELYMADRMFEGNWEEMFGGSFEDSDVFSNLFSTRIGQLAEYEELKNILETDGKLDYDKVVAYITEDTPEYSGGKGYSIGELIKSSGIFVEDIDTADVILLEELFDCYPMEEHYLYKDENGEAALGTLYVDRFIKDFYTDEDWFLVEDYEDALDISQESLEKSEKEKKKAAAASYILGEPVEESDTIAMVEIAVSEQEQQMAELPKGAYWVYTPEDIAYYYTYYVAYYKYYQTLFEKTGEGHRMIYHLVTEDGTETNDEKAEQLLDGSLLTDGRLCYSSAAYTVDTDVSDLNRTYVDNLEKSVLKKHNGFELYVAVADLGEVPDTQNDEFTIKETYFNKAQKLCRVLLVVGIAGVFGTVLSGFYLVAAAGHEKGVGGVRLTWFDKWYTELAAAVCVILVVSAFGVELAALEEFWWWEHALWLAVCIAAGSVVCYLVSLFSLASLVRRIKAGTLWKNSLLRNGGGWLLKKWKRFAHGCRVVYEERDITTRTIVAYVTVLAATVMTGAWIMISLYLGSILILFFLLLFAGIHAGTLYLFLRERVEYKRIMEGVEKIAEGQLNYKVDETGMQRDNKRLAEAVNRVGNGLAEAVEKSIKDERMKTDLITNVSHDIKTPLTSIINYVDLLKRENIRDEKIQSYIEVLDNKSQRLKNLTDDLVEASKLSSGTVVLAMQEINLVELVNQANGEFTEKFAQKNLTIVPTLPDSPVIIEADGRRLWRVLENLYHNVAKYAMEHTRVYVAVTQEGENASLVIKNISKNPLNINADELTERFIRGDVSRSTEGSGLGLSIARSLTELMKGNFHIYLDGDLFRVTVVFPVK